MGSIIAVCPKVWEHQWIKGDVQECPICDPTEWARAYHRLRGRTVHSKCLDYGVTHANNCRVCGGEITHNIGG